MMTERLPDDSRLLLAFMRDHPGLTLLEIWARLRIDSFDLTMARKELVNRNLIVRIQSNLGTDFKVLYYAA